MLADDFVYILAVHVGVPDTFRIDDDYGTFITAIETAGLVHSHFAGAGELELLHARLGVVAHLLRRMIVTASRTALALIAAEEDVPLIVAHAAIINDAGRP